MTHRQKSIMAYHNPSGDFPSPWERQREKIKKEYEVFHKRLEDFPNSFHLVDHRKLSDNTLKSIKNHLEAALKAGYRTNNETAQSLNLLAFVLFKLQESDKALDCVNEASSLEGHHENIVSFANKAYILWHQDTFCRLEDPEDQVRILEKLRECKDFKYLQVKAKAELASSYMRFGHTFNKYAIEAFNEVIPAGREPEVWSWKLAHAVAYRHTLDLQHAPHACGEEDDRHMKVLQMFQEIADKSDSPQLKANALAEIALVLRSTWDIETGQALRNVVEAGPMKICKDALKCDGNEPSVLRKVGQVFRYYKDVHSSLKYLKRAIELQPTSAAYHHLGLTYKAFATEHKYGTLRKRRGRRLGGRRRGRQQGQGVMPPSRHYGDEDMNQDDTDIHARLQTDNERMNIVRAESASQNQHRGRRGRGHKQVEQGAARRGSGAGHLRGRGRTHTHTSEQNSQSEVSQISHASSGTGKDIPMETDDTSEAVSGSAYSQTAHNSKRNPCPDRVQHGHTRVQFRGHRGGYLGQEQSQRPSDDNAYHGNPHQQLPPQRHRYGVTYSQPHCQESSVTPLSRSESETLQSSDSETELKKVMNACACSDNDSDDDVELDGPRSIKPDRLSKTIKSLPKEGVTKFSRDDKYVTETIENLQRAVEFSAEENTRAQYDLALMFIALDEYDEAMTRLQKICQNASAGALDIIAAYEQAGLICYKLAETADDEVHRNRHKKMADRMLFEALIRASRLYSKSADLQGRFNCVFQSPIALLKAVQESDKNHQDKEKERAKLLHLIQKYSKSLSVLKKMAATDSGCTDDVDYQVILIQNQCEMGRFSEAIMSFELLRTTQLGKAVRERLEGLDKNYVLNMYLEAQRHSLHQPDSDSEPGLCITDIFEDIFRDRSSNTAELAVQDTTSKDNTPSKARVGSTIAITTRHVAVVFDEEEEEEIQGTAEIVAEMLRKRGLTVITTDDPCLIGRQGNFDIIDKIDKRLLVVIVGKEPVSELLNFQICATTKANVPVAVLLVNGGSLPHELRGYRSMVFPDELLTAGHGTDAAISVISFLLSKRA